MQARNGTRATRFVPIAKVSRMGGFEPNARVGVTTHEVGRERHRGSITQVHIGLLTSTPCRPRCKRICPIRKCVDAPLCHCRHFTMPTVCIACCAPCPHRISGRSAWTLPLHAVALQPPWTMRAAPTAAGRHSYTSPMDVFTPCSTHASTLRKQQTAQGTLPTRAARPACNTWLTLEERPEVLRHCGDWGRTQRVARVGCAAIVCVVIGVLLCHCTLSNRRKGVEEYIRAGNVQMGPCVNWGGEHMGSI